MYQKDYILRMIEMIGDLIAAILGLIRKGEYRLAGEKLDNLYYTMLREDAAYFRAIPEDRITDILLEEHNFTNGHLEILAELFNAEAELSMAQTNYPQALEYSKKALKLFEFVDRSDKTFSFERINRLNVIRERIRLLAEGFL